MTQKPQTPVEFSVPEALWYLCLGAGLTLAPLPAIHAAPEAFIYFLFESPLPIRTRLAMPEPYWLTLRGLPITAIFLAWALPGAQRPGLPPRSIGVLWLLVAYHPLRYYFEIHYYGDAVARVAALDWAWIADGTIRNLDTPLLIGLAATALVRRHTLRPVLKILFHWVLFVCALWAASHPYDSMVTEILLYRAFGI